MPRDWGWLVWLPALLAGLAVAASHRRRSEGRHSFTTVPVGAVAAAGDIAVPGGHDWWDSGQGSGDWWLP